jgi:uncharacterized protein
MHGSAHWARVRNNGRRLAVHTQANIRVLDIFAFLHDSCRYSDGTDPDHGPRAAVLAETLNGRYFQLDDRELKDVMDACIHHTRGRTTDFNATVLTCWDADRLDLGRVGIFPKAEYLCTNIAKQAETIQWAYANSLGKADA